MLLEQTRLVAVMTRTSTGGSLRSEPTRWISPVSRKRSSERLHPQAHLADFVHEDRAAVGRLEPAALVAVGVGEAAAHVAEQLRLEQRIRHAGAVDGDQRPAAAVLRR